MKKLFNEFKEFIARGNVMDMAIGVIIATAFGKITTSLVNDVFMPLIGCIFKTSDMSALNWVVKEAVMDVDGVTVLQEAVTVGFGTLLATIIDFILVALVVFGVVKTMNSMKKKQEEAPAAPAEPEPTKEELLLTEIRDLLKK